MALKGRFAGTEFKEWLVGFKVSASWVPRVGFGGNFFVYLWQRTEAATPFGGTPELGTSGPAKSGKLEIADAPDLSYEFDNIDLESAHVGATRATRYRMFEFRYSEARTGKPVPTITLSNKSKRELDETALGSNYKYSLNAEQHLLGFRARVGSSQANVFRFVSYARENNSFLKKLVELNEKWVNTGGMDPFKITFSQQDLQVTPENLQVIYVEESWGRFLKFPPPSLVDLSGVEDRERFTRFRIDDYSQHDLLQMNKNHKYEEFALLPEAVQTTTIVFAENAYRDFKIS